jgi:hypothetical protein
MKLEQADDERRLNLEPCEPPCPPSNGQPPAAPPGTPLDSLTVRQAAEKHWPAAEIDTAVAVAKLESSHNRNAVNRAAGGSYGIWQINAPSHPEYQSIFRSGGWRNVDVNARMAEAVWDAASGGPNDGRGSWRPWSVYNSGAYLKFMGGAGGTAPCTPPADPPQRQGGGAVPSEFNRQGNPRTVEQAIAWMSQYAGKGYGAPGERVWNRCERYMNLAYGLGGGYGSATAHWMAGGPRTAGMATPPRGALVFWNTSNTAGHVALSLGGGMIISTDYNSKTGQYQAGMIDIGPITDIDRWGPRWGYRAPGFRPGSES